MSKLDGVISALGPLIDARLNGKIIFNTTIQIPDKVRILMSKSFWAVAEELEQDQKLENITIVNCIVTSNGDYTIKHDEEQLAYYVYPTIVYPIQNWTDLNCSEVHVLLFVIEELCHHFWNIDDEVEVNYKVHEVMKRIIPSIKLEDLYNTQWIKEFQK